MNNELKVSVLCTAYNQEKYIRQTLESFIMQKTNFKFEVLIYDDASTDKTVDIIKEFEKKYPDIIKPIFQKENQYSRGVRGIMMKFLFPLAKGEYIALCEGDDFFTNSNKLQLQADFLNKNPGYSVCFHPVRVFFENNEAPDFIYPAISDSTKFTTEELLKVNFIQTNSVMYRRQEYKDMPTTNFLPNDWYLHLYHAKFGKIGFINEIMSSYRRHPGGIWWSSHKSQDELFTKHGVAHLVMYLELLKLFNNNTKYTEIVFGHSGSLFKRLIEIDQRDGTKLLEKALREFPDEMADFLNSYLSRRGDLNQIVQQKEQELQRQAQVIQQKDQEIRQKDQEIDFMKSSKFWKMREKYVKIKELI